MKSIAKKMLSSGKHPFRVIMCCFLLLIAQEGLTQSGPDKILLVTDRDAYVAGENLLYSLKVFQATTPLKNTESQLAYLVVRNKNQTQLHTAVLKLSKGTFNGSVFLHDTLSTGFYQLLAYTNEMRGDESSFYSKEIFVANRFDQTLAFTDPAVNLKHLKLEAQFYPEGGALISHRKNRVSFKSTLSKQFPVKSKGWVLNSRGDTLASFSSNSSGEGFFTFTPDSEINRVVIESEAGIKTTLLLPSATSGPVIFLNDQDSGFVKASVVQSPEVKSNTNFTLQIKKQDQLILEKELSSQDSNSVMLPSHSWPIGSLKAILLDKNRNAILYEKAYEHQQRNINPLLISLSQDEMEKREKGQFSFQYLGEDSLVWLNVSITPKLAQGLNPPEEIPDQVNGTSSGKVTGRMSQKIFYTEKDGYILRGKVADGTNRGLAHEYVLLNAQDTILNADYTITDSTGEFTFLLPDYYFAKTLVLNLYQPEERKHSFTIAIEDKFQIETNFTPSPAIFPSGFKDFMNRNQKAVTVEKFYTPPALSFRKSQENLRNPQKLYPGTPSPIFPKEYVPLENLVEISRNLIPSLKIRVKKNAYHAYVYNKKMDSYLNAEATVFLDGIKMESIAQVTSLATEDIRKIEVIDEHRFFGELEFAGIVSIFSESGQLENIKWKSSPAILSFPEFSPLSDFQNKEGMEEKPEERNSPDFRQLLYWRTYSQAVPLNETINFYSSDLKGEYLVQAIGITSSGNIVSSSSSFTVR